MNFIYECDKIYMKDDDGRIIAEVTFSKVSNDEVNICHTYVDPSLRGQGIASRLMYTLVTELKKNNKKTTATCSYAIEWFEDHPEYSDIYLNM